MKEETVFYRRNLPHIHPKDGMFFITFRLTGSLPANIIQQLKEDRKTRIQKLHKKFRNKELEKEKYKLEKHFLGKFDDLLDSASDGPHWLKEERMAQIVARKIHELHGKRYRLIAYCIMSNHVHLLIDITGFDASTTVTNIVGKTKDYPLTDTLRLLKGSTARMCNLELGQSGAFWHQESYDHYVRNEREFGRVIQYILTNPVKAGLVEDWREWQFTHLAESPSV